MTLKRKLLITFVPILGIVVFIFIASQYVSKVLFKEPKYHPGGPYYYKSFATYFIPFRPIEEITLDEATTKREYAYYVAYFNDIGRIISFTKHYKGKILLVDKYSYDEYGRYVKREMWNNEGKHSIDYMNEHEEPVRRENLNEKGVYTVDFFNNDGAISRTEKIGEEPGKIKTSEDIRYIVQQLSTQNSWKIYLIESNNINEINMEGEVVHDLEIKDLRPEHVTISPNKKWIATDSFNSRDHIFIMDSTGGNVIRLNEIAIGILSMSWSPTNNQIAVFGVSTSGEQGLNLYLVSLGKETTCKNLVGKFVQKNATTVPPHWSPDGKKIAFLKFEDSNSSFYIVNVRDESIERVFRIKGVINCLSWSPDGCKIIFRDRNKNEYFIYSFQDKTVLPFPSDSIKKEMYWTSQPLVWSPNGQYLLIPTMMNTIELSGDIYIMEISSGKILKLNSKPLRLDGDIYWF